MLKTSLKYLLLKLRIVFFKKIFVKKKTNFFIIKRKDKEVFVGYYDISPFSNCQNYFICLEKDFNSNICNILCFDLSQMKKDPVKIGETTAWSWQLGSRLCWSNDSKLIGYNFLDKKKQCFLFKNFKTKKIEKKVDFPIFHLNKTQDFGLSIDFNFLQKFRPGYGFEGNSIGNGINIVDINKNKSIEIHSIENARQRIKDKFFESSNHYFNHLNWSFSGKFFLFFHIWSVKKKKFNQLLKYQISNGHLTEITSSNQIASHYCWLEDDSIFLTLNENNVLKYVLIDKKNKWNSFKFIPNIDGHPSQNPKNGNIFVTDTYPNIFNNQKLLLLDLKKFQNTKIASIFSPKKYVGYNKCDLHPKWSPNGDLLSCDIAAKNKREIIIFNNLSW